MGNSATVALPPLPEGATLNNPPAGSGGLPPLPAGATLDTPQQGGGGGGLGAWADKYLQGTPEEQAQGYGSGTAAGFVKSAGGMLGTVLDLISRPKADPAFATMYRGQHPQATPEEVQQAYGEQNKDTFSGRIAGHLQDAANWLRTGSEPHGFMENVGAAGEQVIEYLGTEGLLKLAGTAAASTETGSRIVAVSKNLKAAQQAGEFLAAHPKIAGLVGIGLKASKDAATMGAQTYAHTGDVDQAEKGALLGGGIGALGGAATEGGKYLMARAPQMIERLGESFPVLASQLNKAGKIIQGNVAEEAPAIAGQQQAALPGMMRNAARRAVANALEIVNRGRLPVGGPIEDTSRLLQAPEGAQPFTFSLEAAGPAETKEGDLLSRAEPMPGQRGTAATYGTWAPAEPHGPYVSTSPEPATNPPRFGPFTRGTEGGVTAERAGPGYMHPTEPAGAIDTRTDMEKLEGAPAPKPAVEGRGDVTRAGVMQTPDPHEAVQWLQDLDKKMNSPEFSEMSEGEQNAIAARRKTLGDQLKLYYESPYTRRFGAENIPNILDKVHDLGDAQAQLEHVAEPVYQRMDAASNGEFSKWRDQVKTAQKVIRTGSSIEAVDKAMQREAEGNAKILDLIDSHRDQVGFDDYISAKNTWRQASRLGELHTRIERMMNGITAEETEQGMTRAMDKGSTRQLESYLAKDTNRAQLEELLGKDGITNLKEITNMFSSAKNNRAAQDVGKNTIGYMLKHSLGPGTAAMAGAGVARMVGLTPYEGIIGGGLTAAGLRGFMRYAATNPFVGNMLKLAVDKGITPKVYAPLIARVIAQGSGLMQEQPAAAGR